MFQVSAKFCIWDNLTKTILNLKKIATSPNTLAKCVTDLRQAEKLARQDLYRCLGKKIKFNFSIVVKYIFIPKFSQTTEKASVEARAPLAIKQSTVNV